VSDVPAQPRPLPGQPSVRYLKLEAKRRLTTGEFTTLHDAQLAIAREHGARSWTGLRQLIEDQGQPDSHVVAQLRWIAARFRDAGEAGWHAPDDAEMREHFSEEFLTAFPPDVLIPGIVRYAGDLGAELRVVARVPLAARAEIAGLQLFASADPEPPHRISGLRLIAGGQRVTDKRAAGPVPVNTSGDVPAWAAQAVEPALEELGVAGLVLAGAGASTGPGASTGAGAGAPWIIAAGWADLDNGEALGFEHRFAAPGLTGLVTVTAALRLVADAAIGLDAPANDYLRTVRLADDTVTVREVLSLTAGIEDQRTGPLLADSVPDLAAVIGPVVSCAGQRGVFRPGNFSVAVTGQLVADVTAMPYAQAATRLVLAPLAMTSSGFPARTADLPSGTATAYEVAPDGTFMPVTERVTTLAAVGGLWATAGDMLRLSTGWASLLPAALAREALTPRGAAGPGGARAGFGWLLTKRCDIALFGGSVPGMTASLLGRVRDNQVQLTLATRFVPVDSIHRRVLKAWSADATQTPPPARLHSCPPRVRYSVVVSYQPMNIAELARFITAEPDFDARWRLVVEFLKEYQREPTGTRQRLLADAPESTGDERWDEFFAGLAEHLATRDGNGAPAWSASLGLRRFWFPFDTPGARAQALVHAPAAFRRRGVFVADYEIDAA
jgi:CubicO group peptidase (beta-lactamase class C family)